MTNNIWVYCAFKSVRLRGLQQLSTCKEVFTGANVVLKSKTLLHKLVNKLKSSHLITQSWWHPQHSNAADNPHVTHFCTEWAAGKA